MVKPREPLSFHSVFSSKVGNYYQVTIIRARLGNSRSTRHRVITIRDTTFVRSWGQSGREVKSRYLVEGAFSTSSLRASLSYPRKENVESILVKLLEMKGATGDTPAESAEERALSKLQKWYRESGEPGERINPIATMKMDRNGLCYGGGRMCGYGLWNMFCIFSF